MPQVLTMSNGRPETILSPKDFEDLVDKYMGLTVPTTTKVKSNSFQSVSKPSLPMLMIKTLRRKSRRC